MRRIHSETDLHKFSRYYRPEQTQNLYTALSQCQEEVAQAPQDQKVQKSNDHHKR